MILQYEEKRNFPTAKGRENKESHRERPCQAAQGRKEWNDIKISLDDSNLWIKAGINCFRIEFDSRRTY